MHLATSPNDFTPSGHLYTLSLGDSATTFESLWLSHSDPKVDLCALNFSATLNQLNQQGLPIFFQSIDNSFIFSNAQLEGLMAVEEVIMVGYPKGLSDTVHNFPLIRSGHTASHAAVDFDGSQKAVVDMACFPGSSGSPIFLYNQTMFYDKIKQVSTAGPRVGFLGVLFAGPTHDSQGQIVVRQIPTSSPQVGLPITPMMIHLGYYVKSREFSALGCQVLARLGGS